MNRRRFIHSAGGLLLAMANPPVGGAPNPRDQRPPAAQRRSLTLFLGGDVMTGRGIDQALPHPSDPVLYERYVKDARDYVTLAEEAHGPMPRPVGPDYIWGDALEILAQAKPDLRIVNLETAVTRHAQPWPGKGIHYRMHPANVRCLRAAGIDVCTLANNHTLDWMQPGLEETLDSLHEAGIRTAGAGRDPGEAEAPAIVDTGGQTRVLIYSMATPDSGVMPGMSAAKQRPGMHVLPSLEPVVTRAVTERIEREKQPGDIVIASIHWGGNWGYFVPPDQRAFAGDLVQAGVDVIHGHSSHHAKGIEVLANRPVIYGCGDLLNDYEGIESVHDRYRSELVLMYFVTLDAATGELQRLTMRPLRIRRFRLNRATPEEAAWLGDTMHREGQNLNTAVETGSDGFLRLHWDRGKRA
jgi:poly-gamma-glutamate synthesis protein (capsule biosynthesis protein)